LRSPGVSRSKNRTASPHPKNRPSNRHGDKIQQQASTRYVPMTDTLAIDGRTSVQPARFVAGGACSCSATTRVAQLTLLSRTAALAILDAALKQMHVCALLHNDVNHLPHSPACCFFCWPHQPQLPACCLLLAAYCVLAVPAAGWCLAVLERTGACVLGPTCVDLGLAHRNAL
jgi:hypothetical protein